MAVICSKATPLSLSYADLRQVAVRERERHQMNVEDSRDDIDTWVANVASERNALGATVTLGWLANDQPYLGFPERIEDDPQPALWEPTRYRLIDVYSSNVTRLDGSRDGPVHLLDCGYAIADALAFGAMEMAETLGGQAATLLDQRAYAAQDLHAEDLALPEDDFANLTIVPQRLLPFCLELLGQARGEGEQSWEDWDIPTDSEYLAAARAVFTENMSLAETTLCSLANLHVQHSNPFPTGDGDDRLAGFEFDTPLRSLWPTEIHAWLRLRAARGLPLPEVEHPLLDQPLGRYAGIIGRPPPSLWLREVILALVTFAPRYSDLPALIALED